MSADTVPLHSEAPSALPEGTRLGEFELRGVLGIGGFGIVYRAFDHALEREVAVKEYMPAALAGRTETLHVSLRSGSDAETFALGLRSFVNEARLLARFDHPALLKVYRFWEANGTAYMAMPVLRGRTVKQLRQAMPASPDERWLRDLLDPLLGAIERLHAEGVYHRDIAPDNIQVDPDGQPVLLDFGAARRVIGDKSQTLTAILKPSYAPIEQYAESIAVRQGPWTDIYALGATLHYLMLGRPPAPATARSIHDEPSSLTQAALPGVGADFLDLVQWMIAPRPADRPQSIAQVREVLAGRVKPPRPRPAEPAPQAPWEVTQRLDRPVPATDIELPLPFLAKAPATTPAPPADRVVASDEAVPQPAPPEEATVPPQRPVAPRRRGLQGVVLGCGVAVLGAALAAYALWPQAPKPSPAAETAAPGAVPVEAAASATPAAIAPPPAVAESAIATVVIPARPAAAERIEPRVDRPAAALRPVGDRPAAPRATDTPPPGAADNGNPAGAGAAPAALAAAARPAAPAAAAVEPRPVAGPEAECAGQGGLRHFICMERACLRSELATHPDCLGWRKEARRNE